MITFLIYTIFSFVANAGMAAVIWFSIQDRQWLDRLVGWQNMINRIGSKPGAWREIGYKALGGCEFCFCHFMSLLSFIAYCFFVHSTEIGWPVTGIAANIIWYLSYIGTATVISFLTLNSVFREKK